MEESHEQGAAGFYHVIESWSLSTREGAHIGSASEDMWGPCGKEELTDLFSMETCPAYHHTHLTFHTPPRQRGRQGQNKPPPISKTSWPGWQARFNHITQADAEKHVVYHNTALVLFSACGGNWHHRDMLAGRAELRRDSWQGENKSWG